MTARETKAINRLLEAQKRYDEVMAKFGQHFDQRPGSPAGIAITAAWNELNNAAWPFATGKYEWPEGSGYGLELQ